MANNDNLSGGAIAGIVIASLVAGGAGAYLGVKILGNSSQGSNDSQGNNNNNNNNDNDNSNDNPMLKTGKKTRPQNSFSNASSQIAKIQTDINSMPTPEEANMLAKEQLANRANILSNQATAIKTTDETGNMNTSTSDTTDTSTPISESASAPISESASSSAPVSTAPTDEKYRYKNMKPEVFSKQMATKSLDELKEIQGYLEQKYDEKSAAENKNSWVKLKSGRTSADDVKAHRDIVDDLVNDKENELINPNGNENLNVEEKEKNENLFNELNKLEIPVAEEPKTVGNPTFKEMMASQRATGKIPQISTLQQGLEERGNKLKNLENQGEQFAEAAETFKTDAEALKQQQLDKLNSLNPFNKKGGRRRTKNRNRNKKTRRKNRKQTKRIYIIENMSL